MNNSSSANTDFKFHGDFWEEEPETALPKNDVDVMIQQNAIQSEITRHKLIDDGVSWVEVKLALPFVSHGSKPSRHLKDKKYASNSQPIGESKIYFFKNIFLLTLKGINFAIKIFFILVVAFFGGKKKHRKSRSNPKSVKRKSGRSKKPFKRAINNKSAAIHKEKMVPPKGDWKYVDNTFVPTTDLYCYWCSRKLGLTSWELNGHYYCKSCYSKKR